MVRITGIDIPNHLKLKFALQKIKGVGPKTVQHILNQTNLDPSIRAQDLTDEQIALIQKALDSIVYGGELRRQIAQNITRLKNIGSYRGLRHKQNLPVRGQRTKTNARTKRGKRMTVGAFKKSELAKSEQQAKTK